MSNPFACYACHGSGIIDENGNPLPVWTESAYNCACCDGFGVEPVRILITGDRKFDNPDALKWVFHQLNPLSTIIHGGAKGADTLAGYTAKDYGMDVIVVEADWEQFGRAAGPIRNKKMLDMDPDAVIFFHKDLESSKGTLNCVLQARKKGLIVIDGWNWYTSSHANQAF